MRFLIRLLAAALLTCTLTYSSSVFAWKVGNGTTSATINGTNLTVYTYHPKYCGNPSLLFVFHGLSRTASSYRDYAEPLADRYCLIIMAPLFDLERFPSWSYQRGGIVHDSTIQARDRWTVWYVKGLVDWARKREGLPTAQYYLFGHSAGGQFVSRVAAFALADAKRTVVANPSTYVLPSLSEAVAYGLGCLSSGCVYSADQASQELKAYLALPLTIYLGEDDTGDVELNESAAAMRQGATRLERGEFTFELAQAVATANGWPLNWRLLILPGVGHSASDLLKSDQAAQAFGLK
jgi:dienelactone hydrolase